MPKLDKDARLILSHLLTHGISPGEYVENGILLAILDNDSKRTQIAVNQLLAGDCIAVERDRIKVMATALKYAKEFENEN
jgi:hypothetical protein